MSKLVVRHEVDGAGLAALRAPRDDVVAEHAEGSDRFVATDGPFTSYERQLEIASDGDHHRVEETIQYRLEIPYFGWLVALPVRWVLRRFRPGDGSQPFWAPPQRLDPRSAALMGTLATTILLSGFLSNAAAELHTYAADEFGVEAISQGVLGAVVRLGTILALPASILADRRGRRRILGLAIVMGIAASVAAAFSPNLVIFGGVLTLTRTANAALGAMVTIIAIEEMPAGVRAWAVSVLAMSAALGAGTVIWLQPLADLSSWSWRLIFLLPLVMVPFVVGIMRKVPESRRFERRARDVELRGYWGRILLLGGVFFLIALFLSPIDWFRNEYLREEHGFSASRISLFVLATATPGGIGLYFAGRIADVRGRRTVVAVAIVLGLGSIVMFFNVAGNLLWVTALGATILASGLLPALGVFRGEMFPTAIRARAGAFAGVLGVLGGSLGILLAGVLRTEWGSFSPVMVLLWIGPILAGLVVWFRFVEGARRELEELNPEDQVPGL